MAFELVETIELSANSSSLDFQNIPQDGSDLLVLISFRHADNSQISRFTLNSDTGANYVYRELYASGTGIAFSASTLTYGRIWAVRNVETSNTFNNAQLYISNYTSSTDKQIRIDNATENNNDYGINQINITTFSTTSPITSIQFSNFGEFKPYSTASLYKITTA